MADSLDCFSLCFCCFCCSICGQSETGACRWLCPCCNKHKFDDDEPEMRDPELDAMVERQLYEQRAAWAAANDPNSSRGLRHPYAPQMPPPAMINPSEKGTQLDPSGNIRTHSPHSSAGQSMFIPKSTHLQPGSGPVMSETSPSRLSGDLGRERERA